MRARATEFLYAATDDVGPGELWPVAVLSGAFSAAALSAGAWLAFEVALGRTGVALGEWIALHASVGLAGGVLIALLVAAGRRVDVALRESGARRAAASRLSALVAAAACVCAGFSLRPAPVQALTAAAGLALGAGLLLTAMQRVGSLGRSLPRLDPLRVAALVALLMISLQDGLACDSLGDAWRVMLGR